MPGFNGTLYIQGVEAILRQVPRAPMGNRVETPTPVAYFSNFRLSAQYYGQKVGLDTVYILNKDFL